MNPPFSIELCAIGAPYKSIVFLISERIIIREIVNIATIGRVINEIILFCEVWENHRNTIIRSDNHILIVLIILIVFRLYLSLYL